MRLAAALLLLAAWSAECITLASDSHLSFDGRLTFEVFPGPPDYQSVDDGDSPEPTYILLLAKNICIDDGGQFADPADQFNSVQLFTTNAALWEKLKSFKGTHVTVTGSGFPAHTGHHHAPLVLEVESISAR